LKLYNFELSRRYTVPKCSVPVNYIPDN